MTQALNDPYGNPLPRRPGEFDQGAIYGPQNQQAHIWNILYSMMRGQDRPADTNLFAPWSTQDQIGMVRPGNIPKPWLSGPPQVRAFEDQSALVAPGGPSDGTYFGTFNNRASADQFANVLLRLQRLHGVQMARGAMQAPKAVVNPQAPQGGFTPTSKELRDAVLMRALAQQAPQRQIGTAIQASAPSMRDQANRARRGGPRNF